MMSRQEAQTLEYVLTEAEDSWRARLLEWLPRLAARDYPVSITAQFEETGQKNRQIAKLTVSTAPKDVVGILEDLRTRIVAETEPMPVGILRLKAWQDGKSEDPALTLRRTLTAPDHMVDGEKSYLRDRVRSLERQLEVMMGQTIGLNGNLAERLVGMGDLVQKLGTTRAVASTSSEMSTTALIAAAFVLPAMLPSLNRALGIRSDAPITETFRLAQAQLKVHMERSAKDWSEPPGSVTQLPPARTVRELADDAAATAAPAPAEAPTQAPTAWPAAVLLVEHIGDDAAYREEVLYALMNHPPTRAMLKERLPVMQALLELAA